MDLEQFRVARGLSYAKLATLIDETLAAKVRGWALGHGWPQADKLEVIFAATGGAVSLAEMHRRRLEWLRDGGVGERSAKTVKAASELSMNTA